MALLIQQNLQITVSAILALEMLSFFSMAVSQCESNNKGLEAASSIHLFSSFLLIYGTILFDNRFFTNSLIILLFGLSLRAILFAYSRFSGILNSLSLKKKSMLLISSSIYGIFIYFVSINLLSELSKAATFSAYFLAIIAFYLLSLISKSSAPKTKAPLFSKIESLVIKFSQWSHRIFGPIIVEWLTLRISAGVVISIRLLLRFVSYASVQRTMATTLALAIIIILYFAELEWIG